MAVIGITTNTKNPEYTISDFLVWFPQFTQYLATDKGKSTFNVAYEMANDIVFKSVLGPYWSRGMALCIAHIFMLIKFQQDQQGGPDLESISGGMTGGTITSANVGSFSVSYDTSLTKFDKDDAKWWNLTEYGAELYALLKSRPIPTMFVVTPGPLKRRCR